MNSTTPIEPGRDDARRQGDISFVGLANVILDSRRLIFWVTVVTTPRRPTVTPSPTARSFWVSPEATAEISSREVSRGCSER